MLNLWQELNFGVRLFIDGLLERAGQSQDFKLLKEICDHFENDTSYLNNETLKKNCQYLAIACYFQSHDEGVGLSGSSVSPQFLQKLKNEFTRVGIASYDSNFLKKLIPGDTNSFLDSGFHVNEDAVIKLYSRYTSGAKRINNFGALLHDVCNRRIADDQGVNSWNPTIQLFQSAITTQIPSSPPRPEITPDLNLQGPQGSQAPFQDPEQLPTPIAPTSLADDFNAKSYLEQYDELKYSFYGNGYHALTDFKELKTLYEKQNKAKFYKQIDETELDNIKKNALKDKVKFAFFASSLITAKKGEHNSTKTQAFFGANFAQAVIEYAKSIKDEDGFENKISTFTKFACTEARFYDPSVIVSVYKEATKDGQQIDYSGGQQDGFNFYKCKENDLRVDQILNLFQLQNPPSINPIKTKQSDHLKKYITNYGAFGEIHKNKDRDILQLSGSSNIDIAKKRDFLLFSAIHHELEKLTFSDAKLLSDNDDLPILAHIKKTFFNDNPDEYKKFLQNDAYDFLVKLQENDKTPFKTDNTITSIEDLLYSSQALDDTKKKYLEKQALQTDFIKKLVLNNEDFKNRSIDRGEITDVAESYKSFYQDDSQLLYNAGLDYSKFVNEHDGLRSFLVSGDCKNVDLVKFDNKIGCEIDPTRTRYHNITGDKSKERVVNLYSYSRYDEEGRLKSNRKVFLNEKACKSVKDFLHTIDEKILKNNLKIKLKTAYGNEFLRSISPEGLALFALEIIKSSNSPATLKNVQDKIVSILDGNMIDYKNLPDLEFLESLKHFSSEKTNAERVLETLIENGLMIDGSASIIREYSYPEEQKTTSCLSRFCSDKSNNDKHTYVRTESCGFEGKINVQLHASKQVELTVENDGKAKITNGFEYLPTLRHKAHNLKEDGKIETIATKFKKNKCKNISNHSTSIEQQGYGFYFEKTTTNGQDLYELKFRDDESNVCMVINNHRFNKNEFDKFVREYTGEWMPAKFSLQDQSKDNISTAIRRFISKEKHGICKLIAGEKYFDIPVYENNQKIDEILSVKNDGDRSLWILPRFRSRSKVGGRRENWGGYIDSSREMPVAGR